MKNPQHTQENNNNGNMKKEMGQWYEFHNWSTHKTNEYLTKQLLVIELKVIEYDIGFDSELDLEKDKYIIDAQLNATISITKF